jgi:type II secretory pathway pseudopilin PulG
MSRLALRLAEGCFSLLELITVTVILAVLGTAAPPRMLVNRSANIAAVNALAGSVYEAANNVRMPCAASSFAG